jgi:hypothetical protein
MTWLIHVFYSNDMLCLYAVNIPLDREPAIGRNLLEYPWLAQELDLEKITSTNDYELSQVNRRTITENCVTQVVCEIGQVPIWSSNLKLLPNIVQCDILFIKKVWLEWWYRSPQTVQKRQRKCFIYFPRFLPSDLHQGTQHQS